MMWMYGKPTTTYTVVAGTAIVTGPILLLLYAIATGDHSKVSPPDPSASEEDDISTPDGEMLQNQDE